MRDLNMEELGQVYGAGNCYTKPSCGSNKGSRSHHGSKSDRHGSRSDRKHASRSDKRHCGPTAR